MSITYSAAIEKTLRILTPTTVEQSIQISADYVAGSGVLVLDPSNPAVSAIRPGDYLENQVQMWLVQSVTDLDTGTFAVIGGFQGSTDADVTHSLTSINATVFIRPKFSRWDISVALNDELAALSSPEVGLGQILTAPITYVPTFVGYSLPTTFDPSTSKVLEISFAEPLPWKRNPLIRRGEYRVIRNQAANSAFPNGCGVMLYRAAWPGQVVTVQFLSPFSPLVNLTDDLLDVAGVPTSAQDIVCMGAALRLAPDREIQRNTMAAQPDPRKAPEVPANAIQSSANNLYIRYLRRRNEEQKRLVRSFPNAERA